MSFSKDIVGDEYENKKGEKVKVKHEIRSIDSFKFGERYKFLTKKGIYPFDYMNGIENFSKIQLPPKKEFYRPHICRTDIKQFTILYQGPKVWNSLPTDITNSESRLSFKKKILNLLINQYN